MSNITLGSLIEKLEDSYKEQPDRDVMFDFLWCCPGDFFSWRGDYSNLGLGVVSAYSDGQKKKTLSEFLQQCKKTNGAYFDGYKGGEYKMGLETPIWITDRQDFSGHTTLVDVIDEDSYQIILKTEYRQY